MPHSPAVLITGSAGNLGRAIVAEFVHCGANCVVMGRNREQLQSAFGSESAALTFATADLLDQRQVDSAAALARERYGRIGVLCNIAGGFRMGEPVHRTPDDTLNFLFDVNVRTLLHAVRACVPSMIEARAGKIVNVGAFSAQRGGAKTGAYAAAKSAVMRLTESMSAELRDRNINVNCVLPTIIDTPENRAAMPDADPRRWVAPADLAKVIRFLGSEDARAIHGAAIPVTGLS